MEKRENSVKLLATTNPINDLSDISLEDLLAYAFTKSYKSEPNINVVKKYGFKRNHTSPLEFLDFTFEIKNVSRPFLAQLTRHRIGWSYNVESQRYNDYSVKYSFIMPPSVSEVEESDLAMELYLEKIKQALEGYRELRELGVPPEDARFILPPATSVELLAKANLRALLHFWGLRSGYSNQGRHAQWEIRQVANKMFDLVIAEVPELEKVIRDYLSGDKT